MAKQEFTCEKCKKTFDKLSKALQHCQQAHGTTRQQAQNEAKLHARKR